MLKYSVFVLGILVFSLVACQTKNDIQESEIIDGHPAWMMQGNVYEVNIRQYTPEGTFRAFEAHLDRLRDMGVHTLWFMPIQPISKKDRKGTLGSYYAVADYTGINPEYGTMDDWKHLVESAHAKGFKVLIDWVPNHSGADHYWLTQHPDFYVRDSSGNAISQFDWTDTRKLNHSNPELRDTMIEQMKFWIRTSNIDGFRCDMAHLVPQEFWIPCVQELKKMKNIFMLAEADAAWLHTAGFDATYGWPEFHLMNDIAAGKKKPTDLVNFLQQLDSTFPANAIRLRFTSNHDENSWNKADYGTLPGAIHAPFSVLTHTLPRSLPLVYSGQEEPILRAIPFFEKDTMVFKQLGRAAFYQSLYRLRKNNTALQPNAPCLFYATSLPEQVLAFTRENGKSKILVLVNLSAQPVNFQIKDAKLAGKARNIFNNSTESLSVDANFALDAWGYRVYELNQ
jgi:glycosidase